MGGLKTSLTGRIATQAPLAGNRHAGKGGEQPQVSVPGQNHQSTSDWFLFFGVFLKNGYSMLVSNSREKLSLTFTTQRSAIESSHSM